MTSTVATVANGGNEARASRRSHGARLAGAVAAGIVVGLWLPAAAEASGSASSTSSAIDSARAQAGALGAQIAVEQQQIDTLSEQFDQASALLAQAQSALDRNRAAADAARAQETVDRHRLQTEAVDAYIFDEPTQSFDELFSSESDATLLVRQYQATAIGNVQQAVTRLQAGQAGLVAAQNALVAEQQQAATRAADAQADEQAADAADAQARATLAGVDSQIGRLVAEQAAEEAAAAAAAAKAASTEAAKRQEAEQAAEAAQVARTVGNGTVASDQATDAANAANAAAGGPSVIGSGRPEQATGAGAVALAAAERYLGVPYQWGGASTKGVDCSGLVMLAWEAAGVDLPHSAALQYDESKPVPLSQVQPGDLLFYDLEGTGVSHVVMYVGSGPYGSQTIIQAAETGTVVSFDPYWTYGLVGAGRP